MKTARPISYAVCLCLASLPSAVPASAQAPAVLRSAEAPADQPFASGAVDDASLRAITGREDTYQQASANQTASVADNSVGDNVRTGNAVIDGSAFQNLSGLSVLNVNTGNNVAINAAMNVNIAINPAP